MEEPPKKYFRLAPGKEVRLKYAFYITCKQVIKDSQGEIVELICSYDPESRGGDTADGRKVKGTIQWVDAKSAISCRTSIYMTVFFRSPIQMMARKAEDFIDHLNPDSLTIHEDALVEPSVQELSVGQPFQLERIGYFCIDPESN